MVQLENHVPVELRVQVDSDWAGCRTTRKSTSGCVIELLGCPIQAFSRTQGTIATSSGEAELYAIGSGVSEGLGIVNLLEEGELLPKVTMSVMTDSTSAKAIATRMGVSKLTRHIQIRFLYMQDFVANGILKIKKIRTMQNPADVMTKYVATAVLTSHLPRLGVLCDHQELRHEHEQHHEHTMSMSAVTKRLCVHSMTRRNYVYYICSVFTVGSHYLCREESASGTIEPDTMSQVLFHKNAPEWLKQLSPPVATFRHGTMVNEQIRYYGE